MVGTSDIGVHFGTYEFGAARPWENAETLMKYSPISLCAVDDDTDC